MSRRLDRLQLPVTERVTLAVRLRTSLPISPMGGCRIH